MRRKLLQVDLAAALNISGSMVSRLKARGMPTHDIEAARAWRATNLNPMLCKDIRRPERPAENNSRHAIAMMQIKHVKLLSELAGENFTQWGDQLRAAMAAVPSEFRDQVLLSVEVWDALLDEQLRAIDEWAGISADDNRAAVDEVDPLVDHVLYELACGLAIFTPGPAVADVCN